MPATSFIRRLFGAADSSSDSVTRSEHRQPLFFFDETRFAEDLKTKPPIAVFKDAIAGVNHQFDIRFKEGENIRTLVLERARFMDLLLCHAWDQFEWPEDIALLAVGGYGRRELLPQSDIDLLILLGKKTKPEKCRGSIEGFITFLWDISLQIGHSVRTVKECATLAKDDITIATALMECHTIIGNDSLRDQMLIATGPDKIWPSDKFFQAKWEEQKERHRANNNTEYNLEPNVKNGPGGLRDIQMIGWVTKRHFVVRTLDELMGQSDFLTETEFASIRSSEDFLWRVRWGLHILAKRPEERLLFEHQLELAKLLQFEDSPEAPGVELFMRQYYRMVLAASELNDVLLQYWEENILRQNKPREITNINDRFQLVHDYIETTSDNVFEETPSALLEIFYILANNPHIKGVRASTIRSIKEHRFLIDEQFNYNPENTHLFLSIMRSPHRLMTQLKRMKRYGILGRYLPEFGKITGLMQHDMFHIYTVDAHTLLVMRNLRNLRLPETQEKLPQAYAAFKSLPKRDLLYIAGLYHDIAKGRGGDHAKLGEEDARQFCKRHRLGAWDTNLVAWLVEQHLLMSAVAQKQDISDPEVVHQFAQTVGDSVRLDYLYCLTVGDINGTNPTLLTPWKESLLRQLYQETKRVLNRGVNIHVDRQGLIDSTKEEVLNKVQALNIDTSACETLWDTMGDEYFLLERSEDIVWHTENTINKPHKDPLILIRNYAPEGEEVATQVFIRIPNRDNLFVAAASALNALNLNIQDAHLYSSSTDYAMDTFYVLTEQGAPIENTQEARDKIRKALHQELELVDNYEDVIQKRTARRLKHFSYPTQTRLETDSTNGYTALEVISPDRPGLLACIGRVFMEHDIRLQNAKIATLGERVEDVFFITDEDNNPLTDEKLCITLQDEIRNALDERNDAESSELEARVNT